MNKEELKKRCLFLRNELITERSSFISHWRELADYILPRRIQLTPSDTNKGDKRNSKIIDSTATMSVRVLKNGMMTGITSPARKWFDIIPHDAKYVEMLSIRKWLYNVREVILNSFLRSNLYNVLPIIYGDLGVFGTGCLYIEEDPRGGFRFYTFPIGSYAVSNNSKMQIDTFMREFRLTVRQVVEKFGYNEQTGKIDWTNISDRVKSLYNSNKWEEWIDIVHYIIPNKDWNPNDITSKKYLSIYMELDSSSDKFLRVGGYSYFPVLVPRWEVSGSDVYGTDCPGMTALGDIKELQLLHRRHAQILEKKILPPLVAPVSLKTQKVSLLPNDITYIDDRDLGKGLRPVHDISVDLNHLYVKIQAQQERIKKAFFEDLFMLLAFYGDKTMTAREVQERHEEKLLVLGAVLEQLNQDLLDPLISISFHILNSQGLLPPAPRELSQIPLRIEYLSIMHQAQKLIGISSLERVLSFSSTLGAINPEVLDKIDFDSLVTEYINSLGIPVILRADEEVERIRAQRQMVQEQQMQLESLKQGTEAAKNLNPQGLEAILPYLARQGGA